MDLVMGLRDEGRRAPRKKARCEALPCQQNARDRGVADSRATEPVGAPASPGRHGRPGHKVDEASALCENQTLEPSWRGHTDDDDDGDVDKKQGGK